ncbi:MAG TPA: cytochrome c oxidase subunit II [Candidatus Binataceae bacterium]|nr:cytochrome c oxidase subunit II [Candidatus Binataceae bacterium]
MEPESYEKGFLAASAVMLAIFLAALAYSAAAMGIALPGQTGAIYCNVNQRLRKVLRSTPPFDSPGVHQTAPGKYDVVVIGQTWSYTPDRIEIPAGSEVTFRGTSSDVIHGFLIAGTNVNMMLVPGEISTLTYRFDKPGEYLLLCHEYCGRLHHTMSGKVIVK